MVAVTMHILGRVVRLGVWLVTTGSEVKCNVEIVNAFLIGLAGQPEVAVAEGLTDALLDIFILPRCCYNLMVVETAKKSRLIRMFLPRHSSPSSHRIVIRHNFYTMLHRC